MRGKILLPTIVMLGVVACGCSATGIHGSPAAREVLTFDQAELTPGKLLGGTGLRVEVAHRDEDTWKTTAITIVLKNTASHALRGGYRFKWFEPSGREATTKWTGFSAGPKKAILISSISPVPGATAFRLELGAEAQQEK